jgi:cytochrome c556
MGKAFGRVTVAVIAFALVAPVAVFAQDAIKARKDDMQLMRKSVAAVKAVVDGKEGPEAALAPSQALEDMSKRLLAVFPAGSDQGETRATALIWSDQVGFEAAVANFNTAASALLVASNAANLDGIKSAFDGVGRACGACHDKYRSK